LGALVLMSSPVFGEQKDGFWDRLQTRLEKVTPSKKVSAATAVGGVRGAKNDDSADIYWKGRDKALDMNDEELGAFNRAMESRRKGEHDVALKQFEEFLSLYPQSQFRVEGLQAAELLKTEIAAAKAAAKAEPEPKPAEAGGVAPAAPAQAQPSDPAKPASEQQPVK